MNSSIRILAVVISGVALAGVGLQPLEERVARNGGGAGATFAAADADVIMGRGLSVAVLGGFRALVADALWLRTYVAWSSGDWRETQALIQLVTLIDDRPLCFWLNGARMLAYDMTQWRLGEAGAAGPVPADVSGRVREEQAELALRHLERARRRHPDSAELCVEMANIHLNLRADVAAAADWYRKAAEAPEAPYYAARIHAELLKRLGRTREAYSWLCRLHPSLPSQDERAMPDVILKRIRELEKILATPLTQRYAGPAATGAGAIAER